MSSINPEDKRLLRVPQWQKQPQFPLVQDPRSQGLAFRFSPRGPLYANPDMGADVRVAAPLAVQTASPYALHLMIGRGFKKGSDGSLHPDLAPTMKISEKGQIAANVTASDVEQDADTTGIAGSNVSDALTRLQANSLKVTTIQQCANTTLDVAFDGIGDVIVEIDNSSASCTVNLPTASTIFAGRRITAVVIAYNGANTITIAGSLEGAASVALTALREFRTWYCTSTTWERIG